MNYLPYDSGPLNAKLYHYSPGLKALERVFMSDSWQLRLYEERKLVYTADLTPDRIFEFLLLNEEFPHSVRFSIDSVQCALEKIQGDSGRSRAEALQRLSGKLRASLSYSSVDEILSQDVVGYLRGIQAQCRAIHETIYELYVDYSIQAALAG